MSQHDNAVAPRSDDSLDELVTFGAIALVVIFGIIFLTYAVALLVGFWIVGKAIAALIDYWCDEAIPSLYDRYSETFTPRHYEFERYAKPTRLPPPPVAEESIVTEDEILFDMLLTPGFPVVSPIALANNRAFVIVIDGSCQLRDARGVPHIMDGGVIYETQRSPDEAEHHLRPLIDGHRSDPIHRDEAEHCYVYPYLGTGDRLRVGLDPPPQFQHVSGWLRLIVRAARPSECSTIAGQVYQREQARRAEKRLEEERQAELRQRVDDAVVAFEHRAHYADESFIRNYARVHKDALLAANSAIVRDRIERHRDTAFIEALKKSSLATYDRMQLRDKAAAWAEQLDVQPPPPPPRNRPKKPATPTAEKQRAERGRHLVIQAEDLLAHYELREEIKKKAREMKERQGFDSDVFEELDADIDRLFRQMEDDRNGKTY
jgi:hypothetical protein